MSLFPFLFDVNRIFLDRIQLTHLINSSLKDVYGISSNLNKINLKWRTVKRFDTDYVIGAIVSLVSQIKIS